MKEFWNQHKHKFVALGSALGTASVMYAIWGSIFVLLSFFVVVIHEMGHIIAAHISGAEIGYTFFIPLIIAVLGATQITNIPTEKEAFIAISGPIAGLIGSILLFIYALLFGLQYLIWPIILLVVFEVFNLVVGSDAKKYKKAKKKWDKNDNTNIGCWYDFATP